MGNALPGWGYRLVGCDRSGTNAFFVHEDIAGSRFPSADVARLYRPPLYNDGKGHPSDPSREMAFI